MKAIFHYRATEKLLGLLADITPDWLEIAIVDPADDTALLREIADADVLWHALKPVTETVMAAAPRLKLVQKIGVGLDTIDRVAAERLGIAVANMPGSNSQAVAEATLALMFAALRRVVPIDAATRAGRGWTLPIETYDQVGEIAGRTVGLLGYGEIPARLVPVLKALGATVLYHSRTRKPEALAEYCGLDDLLARADILSLHIPLTPETRQTVDAGFLARMKPGAVLINTARGGLVDEAALAAALTSGRLMAAGLDVLAVEPAGPGNPLFLLENVVFSPHVAWLTPETLQRSFSIAIENCRRLKDGEALLHQARL
jgi:phosphoglycerate dehydrogenase-like enzyme